MTNPQDTKNIAKDFYQKAASGQGCGCCCSKKAENAAIAKSIGYADEEIAAVPEANLGLGCGNPTALASIRPGDTVLDLGSGAGLDCFLAAKKTGTSGQVIGVDMTEDMIKKAQDNAQRYGFGNVSFKLGDIEDLPVESSSVDVIISNCVINLAPDKSKVFNEAYRVLKTGGSMYVSDIVLLAELTPEQKNDHELIAGCVGGAVLKDAYLAMLENAGFKVNILDEDKEINKRQYQGIALESLKIQAVK